MAPQTEPRAFEVVRDEPTPEGIQDSPQTAAASAALLLALRALSARAFIALLDAFALFTVALVFWLWLSIIAKPTPEQIVAMTIFSIFVVGINLIVRRR